ncbi:hypothetical protein CA11_10640 [Gimesia maris]|uniref:hypothetical protein n=1 Tax=Gimesia maris TaxID=122 RepID=UPI00118B654A|nr:hypothetical protein [Gimesia maris]QDU13282.1 hypothetical protein CA11_10640 [Gimesia maris]
MITTKDDGVGDQWSVQPALEKVCAEAAIGADSEKIDKACIVIPPGSVPSAMRSRY